MTQPSLARTHTLLLPTARLDGSTAVALLAQAKAAFERGARVLVLDLSRVVFIDSLGVAAIAAIADHAPEGASVRIASLGAHASVVTRVTHLDEVVEVYATVQAALA